VGIAMWAGPRISLGVDGWMRHLPAGGRDHRKAMHVALIMSQVPVFGFALVLSAGAVVTGLTPSPGRLAGILALPICAACAGLPGSRRWLTVPAGLAAGGLCITGAWPFIFGALGMAAIAHGFAGGRSRALPQFRATEQSRLPLPWLIAWRAIAGRLPAVLITPLLALGGTVFFVINNQMSGAGKTAAIRLGALLAAGLLVAGLAESLALMRPAWPWARSLPWSAGDRIKSDAMLLGAAAVAWMLPAAFADFPGTAIGCAAIPLIALRGASGIRSYSGRRPGPAARLSLESIVISGSMAITPWAALPALLLIPVAYRWAVIHERRFKVTAWKEQHHLAAGDTLSWSPE
jgi:hypothetical protein